MSKFLQDSEKYSTTQKIKDVFIKIISEYNDIVGNNYSDKKFDDLITQKGHSICINNNIKYYLLVVLKSNIMSIKKNEEDYTILYFIPLNETSEISDFYMEINLGVFDTTKGTQLYEGYLYNDTFLISDILYFNEKIITYNYNLRYNIINNSLFNYLDKLKNLNGIFNIGIHNIIDKDYIELYKNNNEFKNQLNSIEYIHNTFLLKHNIPYIRKSTLQNYIVCKTNYPDVYQIYDNNNIIGILYIKTLKESNKLYKLFENKKELLLQCQEIFKYNTNVFKRRFIAIL